LLGGNRRAFVDDDELGRGGGSLVPKFEARRLLAAVARLIDEAMDGRGAVAALVPHHTGGFAGEGREQDLAVDAVCEMFGQRRLADSGIAEQAGYRRAPTRSFEPPPT